MEILQENEYEFKWSYIDFQLRILENLIEGGNDLFLYGISGSGQTTLVQDILQQQNIKHVKINCITSKKKDTILKSIIFEFNHKFGLKLPPCSKLHQFINTLQSINWSQIVNTSEFQPVFLVFDNIEQIEVKSKFLNSFLNIQNSMKINLNVIFIGVSIPDYLILECQRLNNIPHLCLNTRYQNHQAAVIKRYFNFTRKMHQSQKAIFIEIGDSFCNDVVDTFNLIMSNLRTLISVASVLFEHLITLLEKNTGTLKKYTQAEILKTMDQSSFKEFQKAILENPYLSELGQENIQREITQSILVNRQRNSNYENSNIQIPQIASFLLLAAYIGGRNQDTSDYQVFKDYKRAHTKKKTVNSKNEVSENIAELQKVKHCRLIALAQSLISVYHTNFREINSFDQTIDFYSQIENLVELNLLKRVSQQNEDLISIKYFAVIDQQYAKNIAVNLGVDIEVYIK